MNESEAIQFIAKEVSRVLWQRLAVLGSLFGIANVIALVALWHTITSEAQRIAQQQVRTTAAEYATQSLDNFTEITNAAKERITILDKSYADLYIKVGEANVGLTQLQSNREKLQSSLSTLATETSTLRLSVDSLKTTDVARIGQLVNLLNTVPNDDVKSLVKAFTEATPQVDALRGELTTLATKVESDLKDAIAGADKTPQLDALRSNLTTLTTKVTSELKDVVRNSAPIRIRAKINDTFLRTDGYKVIVEGKETTNPTHNWVLEPAQ